MRSVRLALIGCGAAARSYYVPALRALPPRHLWLVDTNEALARQLAADLGTANYARHHLDVLDKVDGVIIALPHSLHFPVALDCLRSGLHVLCEKPVAETRREVDELLDEARARGVTISVNNTRRLFPSFGHVKELVAAGAIGHLRSIHIVHANKFDWPSATGFYVDPRVSSKGVLLDEGAHALDLVCWWLDGRPDLVGYRDDSFGGPESVAQLTARRNGCEIDVRLNRLVDGASYYRITGDEATIECHPYQWRTVILIPQRGRPRTLRLRTHVALYRQFVEQLVHNLVDVIQGRAHPMIPASVVRDSIALIEECYRARQRLPLTWYDNLHALFA